MPATTAPTRARDDEWTDAVEIALAALSWGVAPTTVQVSVAWDAYTESGQDATILIAAWIGGRKMHDRRTAS
jgi:hypothetical protein